MAYPAETYINEIADPAVRKEIQQLYSLFQGYLSQQHKETGAHAAITADSVTVSGAVAVTGAGTYGGDVIANSGRTNDSSGADHPQASLTGGSANASISEGAALDLGKSSDTSGWRIQANGSLGGTPGAIASLEFVPWKDSNSFRRAMRLSQADTPVAGSYYLVSGASSKLYIGSPTGALGASAGAIEAVYSNLGFFEAGRSAAAGKKIAPTFAAGIFDGSGTMTWTVIAGNVATFEYFLLGDYMYLTWYLTGGTAGGTAAAELRFTIPGGFTAQANATQFCRITNGGVDARGTALVAAAGTKVRFFVDDTFATNWTLGTVATQGSMWIRIA